VTTGQKGQWDLKGYRIEDIFQMAVAIEEGGYEFYDQLIKTAAEPGVKNEMKFLRDEEGRHKDIFLKHLTKTDTASDRKISGEMQRLLEDEFFKPMKKLYKNGVIEKNVEALRFGLTLEQKTIDFYSALKEQSQDQKLQDDLDEIIEEEKNHKMKLNILLSY